MFDQLIAQPLICFLRGQNLHTFSLIDWDQLVRQARRTNLLCRVAYLLRERGQLDFVPTELRWHFDSVLLIADSSRRSTLLEIRKISEAMASAGLSFVLLKGAAYTALDLEPSHGRLFSDIDILVKHAELDAAEQALIQHGWLPSKFNRYDQKYYRQWMHELPPLQHTKRHTSIDVHHTLLPPTAKPTPDVSLLWKDAVPVPAYTGCYVLCAADRILHSATHLFHDGDFEQGLRDLVDLDALISAQTGEDGFWPNLLERATKHQLGQPLYYALRYCHRLLGTAVPDQVLLTCKQQAGINAVSIRLIDALMAQVILPPLTADRSTGNGLAGWVLYVRSHYLRMPLYLLVPHLVRKALRGEQ